MISVYANHMCLVLLLPVQSLLTCFRSFLALRTLSLITLPHTKAFLCFIVFSGSPTAVHHPLHALRYYTVGIAFWTARKRQSQTSKFDGKATNYTACSSHLITHYHYVRVTEEYTETLHVKKMADLVTVM